ncbi:MAG: hypothetical protein KDC38_00175 [Planctomycetes bacterium]|nr:hypothetical protein [Planctomycetota bacterium]
MRSTLRVLVTLVLAATSFAFTACPAFADKPGSKPPASGSKGSTPEKKESWAVVRVGEELQVMLSTEVKKTVQQVKADYEKQSKEWNEARAAAAKAKKSFDTPKPTKLVVKVLNAKLESREKALEFKAREEEKAKKGGKEEPKKGKKEEPKKGSGGGR